MEGEGDGRSLWEGDGGRGREEGMRDQSSEPETYITSDMDLIHLNF